MRRRTGPIFRHGSSERIRQLLVTGKTFALLSISSMVFFVAAGLGGMIHQEASTSPLSSMKGFAASVSGQLFSQMLSMELPAFEGVRQRDENLLGKQTAAFMLRVLTNVNPADPRSLVASELPGLSADDAVLLRMGSGGAGGAGPKDQQPIPTAEAQQEQPTPSPGESGQEPPDGREPTINEDRTEASTPDADRKQVFIYHSHPRESWYTIGSGKADSKTDNITLVGKRLAEKLEEEGIGALHSDTDYSTSIKNYRWELSYKYSKETVKSVMAEEPGLNYFFDIHRDSQRRKHTTATIEGQDYAQVFFIIGHRNPDWKKNEAFATKLHEALEAEYPGISRGIWGKSAATGNGEYNQSLSENSVLVEVGGVDNTLEESYRTADALAKTISKIYWESRQAEKATAPAVPRKS